MKTLHFCSYLDGLSRVFQDLSGELYKLFKSSIYGICASDELNYPRDCSDNQLKLI